LRWSAEPGKVRELPFACTYSPSHPRMDLRSSCKPNIFGPARSSETLGQKPLAFLNTWTTVVGCVEAMTSRYFLQQQPGHTAPDDPGPSEVYRSSKQSLTANVSPIIPSTMQRLANLNFAAANMGLHANTCKVRLRWLASYRATVSRQRIDACISAPAQNERRDQATRAS
jgi:hypothetical protein